MTERWSLARRLTRLATDMDLDGGPGMLRMGAMDAGALDRALDELGFGAGMRQRLERIAEVAA